VAAAMARKLSPDSRSDDTTSERSSRGRRSRCRGQVRVEGCHSVEDARPDPLSASRVWPTLNVLLQLAELPTEQPYQSPDAREEGPGDVVHGIALRLGGVRDRDTQVDHRGKEAERQQSHGHQGPSEPLRSEDHVHALAP